MVARRCSAKKLSEKFRTVHREIPVLESLSNTVKYIQAVWLSTFVTRDPHTGVSEPAVRISLAK